jgi:flavin reductase (DIM6/NTAB) family NADH-FMN oxidoreductase RutF
MTTNDEWKNADEFETIASGNKPFSLKVPALVVTRGNDGRINMMLSMWFTPMGFDPSSFVVAVDKKTKTYDLMNETGEFVIAAPSESMFDAVIYSGSVSGHKEDKWAACGLTAVKPSVGKVPLIGEALANVEMKVGRMIPFDERFFLVVGEVQICHVKKQHFRDGIYLQGADPLLWLGKESGAAHGNKTARNHAAGMGRTWEADFGSPLLSKIQKTK